MVKKTKNNVVNAHYVIHALIAEVHSLKMCHDEIILAATESKLSDQPILIGMVDNETAVAIGELVLYGLCSELETTADHLMTNGVSAINITAALVEEYVVSSHTRYNTNDTMLSNIACRNGSLTTFLYLLNKFPVLQECVLHTFDKIEGNKNSKFFEEVLLILEKLASILVKRPDSIISSLVDGILNRPGDAVNQLIANQVVDVSILNGSVALSLRGDHRAIVLNNFMNMLYAQYLSEDSTEISDELWGNGVTSTGSSRDKPTLNYHQIMKGGLDNIPLPLMQKALSSSFKTLDKWWNK
jgi:hypothetical protein